jgi:GPH family glycoside/pentoside/hexuronide:cation symporter
VLFYLAYTVFATPWVAMGYELTPDYHERTRLMGVQNFIGQIPYMISPWFLWIMTNEAWFGDQIQGAGVLAIGIAVTAVAMGVLPAIFLRERLAGAALPVSELGGGEAGAASEKASFGSGLARNMREFLKGLRITVSSRPFLKLCLATFLVFNGFILISSFQFYVIIYYVFGGDQLEGAKFAGYAGTTGAVSTFLIIILVTWLGTKIGKRRAFFVSTGISVVGYALKWVCYNPEYPFLVILPAPLMAFGLGGLFTLLPSMVADVVDLDELSTHQRREGMFGSIFWWVVKLGMAAALAGGGYLLNATGFDVALEGAQSASAITLMRAFDAFIPAATSLIAIWAVWSYPLTEEKAHEIRTELERRRGAAPGAAEV